MNPKETVPQDILAENQRLKAAIEELSALNEIATAISSTQPLDQIIDLIVSKCIKHVKVEQAAVMLLNEKDENKPFHTMIRKQDSLSNILPYHMDSQLTGWMLKNEKPLIINNLSEDSRFKFIIDKDFPVHSLLCVPMIVKGKITGLLTVFNNKAAGGFTLNDQKLLGIIAAQSAHVIENARLYQDEQALIHLREEMRLAYEIQSDLLPKTQPELSGYEIAGKSISAKEVGGDYYDFIRVDDNSLAFCLGDVSGKGITAALLMSNIQATIRGQTVPGTNCKDCVSFANDMLFRNTAAGKFATLFYGIIDTTKNELCYCNGGHNNPLFFHNNKLIRPDKGGLIIGIMPSLLYEEETFPFNPGDLLVIFSDGITEAMNINEEEFGEERLIDLILQNKNTMPSDLIDIIIKNVTEFSGKQPQMDDITLVIINRKE